MEQRLAALFASVGNALDSSTYTYSDSDYLVRKALVKFLDEENALVASARKVHDTTEVVDAVLNYVISTDFNVEDPAEWYRKAMRIVVEFSDFAYRNEMSQDSARYAALLPEGHPRVLRVTSLTASAQREALASWMAADPRLDEESSAQVYRLYTLSEESDDVEAEFETLKAEALVSAGRMPEDLLPIVAAFNLSFAQRSAISKALAAVRRRDRKGRFAKEFGRLKLFFKGGGGEFFSEAPRIVGPGRGENSYNVEFDGDGKIPKGVYEVDASLGENVKAYLPKRALKDIKGKPEVVAEADKKYAIDVNEFLKGKKDAPENWEKAGKGFKSKDGKFTATPVKASEAQKFLDKAKERGDETILSGTGAGDAFDPENPNAFLVADSKGRTKGVAQDWAGVQEIAIANGATFNAESGDFEPRDGRGMSEGAKRAVFDEPLDTLNRGDDSNGAPSKESLSDDMLGEGYNLSKLNDKSWIYEGGEDTYVLSKLPDGSWELTREYGDFDGSGINRKEESVATFDDRLEAFEYTADMAGQEWDQSWVDELLSDQGADLDQNVAPSRVNIKTDRNSLSPELAEKYAPQLDAMDKAIFENDQRKIGDLLSDAANDRSMPDEVYSALYSAKNARSVRNSMVENALAGGSKEDIESLLDDPEFAGWSERLENALEQDLDQDAPALSEKQSEPATGKQYALFEEYLAERDLDPTTEQALRDAIDNKNLNKAQASSLIALGRAAGFKEGVDPNKPSERMLNSLQGYLATKDLTPSEIKDTLDSLEKDGSRDNVDALLNKLRRKKDKPVDLNQASGSLIKYGDDNYEWEDVYNNVSVQNGKNGWEVEYTNPDLNDRGGQTWHSQRFNSEEEALAFAEELVKQNQNDDGYGRAADDMRGLADLDQDAKGTLQDAATDKQWGFLESLLNGKKIDNPELEAAVRSALNDRNLTKGEVGAFIGQLRPLEDKPNVRREPSAKQIASIKRAMLERGLSPEEKKNLQDKLDAGMSFDEASEALNDLKSRPITPQGMNDLLDDMLKNQDLDGLKYLLTKPEYDEFRDDIRDTIQTLRRDQGTDKDFDPDLDLELGPDLDQGLGGRPSAEEISQDGNDIIDEIESMGPISDETDEEFRDRIQGYRDALNRFVDIVRTGNPDLIERGNINLDRNTTSSDVDPLLDELEGLATKARVGQSSSGVDGYLDNISNPENWTNWGSFPEYVSPDGRLEIRVEGDPDGNYLSAVLDGKDLNLDRETEKDILDAIEESNFYSGSRGISEKDKRETAQYVADLLRGPDLNQGLDSRDIDAVLDAINKEEVIEALSDGGFDYVENEENFDWTSPDGKVNIFIEDDFGAPVWVARVNGKRVASDLLVDKENLGNEIVSKLTEADGPDLNQDSSRSISRDDFADKIADDIDALDKSYIISGDELQDYLDEFDRTKYPNTALEMSGAVYNMSNYVDDPDLKQRIRDLSVRMDQEVADRFGVSMLALADGEDILDLDTIDSKINDERDAFFETDADEIERALSRDNYYGDAKSGGAEVFISQEDDGTWTASVQYDRGDDQFTGTDRDEVARQAAEAAADYNSDVIPSSYMGSSDLAEQAEQAKTDQQALDFADSLDAVAADIENHRGDQQDAFDLQRYAERIREIVAERQARNESQVPDEPTTPETMDEMAVDPDLNPAGYAEYVADELYNTMEGDLDRDPVMGREIPGRYNNLEYESKDGRIKVSINEDGDYDDDRFINLTTVSVEIDGEPVGDSRRLFDSDDVYALVREVVEEHFSKKA